ncbi:IclR family transcriptional regulator C-terminal domain-containing protein [Tropicimonas sp. TH_r6]|uniref:IclR family transcriptional regulator domain-containing protein n=1 Tax=Tropicimonas sp. TH_r6 TaxID=3082085 RepID=UPI0029548146|nr:IclR family transcriptional regulator C-terminal domain-containing protein [Tropicimonas sp. TH_r6]MDV7142051.1 IclR family transcriptional regulator C-terminal domain-containing protein [Tropicimonas sp. TH_r6]
MRETGTLAQISGDHIIYSLRLPNQRMHFAASLIGRRINALGTAGRVMLATWPEAEARTAFETWSIHQVTPKTITDRSKIAQSAAQAARDGYSITQDQMILKEISIAAPILNIDRRADAAVQVSVSSLSYDIDTIMDKILPTLLDVAGGIQG